MFLQAAGTPSRVVAALYEQVSEPELTARQQTLVAFADKLTRSPETFSSADTSSLRAVLPDEGEVIEAANVVAGFNFANRVADALAVPQEIPALLQRTRVMARGALSLWAGAVRMRMNFVNRRPEGPPPDEVFARLQTITREAGLGSVPAYFERLRVRPHILAGQAQIYLNLFSTVRLARPTILRVGYLVSSMNGDLDTARELERVAEESGIAIEPAQRVVEGGHADGSLSRLEANTLAFTHDVTRHAHRTTDEQVESLRGDGLDDGQILELVLLTAAFNAGSRLSRALVGVAA